MEIAGRFQIAEASDAGVEKLGLPVFSQGAIPSICSGSIPVAGIVEDSVVDGPGIRLTVFVQGCPHRCPGCHNPHTHDFSGGRKTSPEQILALLTENPMNAGLTLSGGEPFSHAETLYPLAYAAREMGYTIVTYTGYRLEELLERAKSDSAIVKLLLGTDLLIDGRYIENRRNLTLLYRGSDNQRLFFAGN